MCRVSRVAESRGDNFPSLMVDETDFVIPDEWITILWSFVLKAGPEYRK